MSLIAPRERLIVALDFTNKKDALALAGKLEGAVSFYKVGLELFVAEGPELVRELRHRGNRVFLDLKMDDVGETIRRAVDRVAALDVQFLTILGAGPTALAANEAKGASLKILQVTVLTSLGEDDLRELHLVGENKRFASLEEYVAWRAETSIAKGCDGLISSGQNLRMLREKLGPSPIIVCPGIRPSGGALQDHKRPSTPRQAIADGADYLVVGRPIRDAADPAAAAREIIGEIAEALPA